MTTIPLTSSLIVNSRCDHSRRHALQLFFSRSQFSVSESFPRKCSGAKIGVSPNMRFRVDCESRTQELQIRKCSPFLEKTLLSSNGALDSDDWVAVPDIWRYSAEKYGDRVALVDPYHNPPTNMTYKEQMGTLKLKMRMNHKTKPCSALLRTSPCTNSSSLESSYDGSSSCSID